MSPFACSLSITTLIKVEFVHGYCFMARGRRGFGVYSTRRHVSDEDDASALRQASSIRSTQMFQPKMFTMSRDTWVWPLGRLSFLSVLVCEGGSLLGCCMEMHAVGGIKVSGCKLNLEQFIGERIIQGWVLFAKNTLVACRMLTRCNSLCVSAGKYSTRDCVCLQAQRTSM